MSSTKRGGQRSASNYYVTPVPAIEQFLRAWHADCPTALVECQRILDPCAGGTVDSQGAIKVSMSYPKALSFRQLLFLHVPTVETMDIRQDSPAEIHADYLTATTSGGYDLIISNPPFALASEFICKALEDVRPGGWVVMLLRLNFLGGTTEKPKLWAKVGLPVRAYVHAQRMGFNGHRADLPKKERNGTDSIEYAHMIWRSGIKATETILKVI